MSDIVKSPYTLEDLFSLITEKNLSFVAHGAPSHFMHRTAYHVEVRGSRGPVSVCSTAPGENSKLSDVLYTAMRPFLGEVDA